MPHTLTAPERTLIGGPAFITKVRVELEDQAGAWQNIGAFMGRDYFVSAQWREGIDQPVASGTLMLSRRVQGESISPTIAAATANHPGGGDYAPFIRGRQKLRIWQSSVAPGVTPAFPADYREVFRGRIDNPDWGGRANQVTLPFSDQGAWIMGQQIDTLRTYSDDVGQPLETVMQAILDDNPNPALPGLTLFVPVPTGINVKTFQQERVTVMTALVTLAQQFAYDIRFRYDPTDGVSKLTLSLPDRDNDLSSPDWSFTGDEYIELPNIGINTDDVRTRGRVYYNDAATGTRLFEEYANTVAQAEFGDIYFEIGEEATSNIDSAPEALNMITAAVKDLSAPKMSQRMETTFLWAAQLGDIARFEPNGEHYDEAQALAVVGIEHTLTRESRRTALDVRGNPAGAYSRWLALGTVVGEVPPPPTLDDVLMRPTITPFFHPDTKAVDAIVDVNPTATAYVKVKASGVSIPTAVQVMGEAPIATAGAARVTVPGVITTMTPNTTAYISALAFDADDNASDLASAVVTWPAGVVAPSLELLYAFPNPLTGLTSDVGIRVSSPLGLGGTLRLWNNHDGTNDPNANGPVEYSFAIGATPATVNEATDFWVEPAHVGTFKALNDVRVHPTQGKIFFAEFIDSAGVSSGQQAFVINGGGGMLDDTGNLKPGAIFSPSQITDHLITITQLDATLRPPVFSATAPSGSPPGGVGSLVVYNSQIYKWNGSSWVNTTDATAIVGQLTSSQIAPGAIGSTQIAAGLTVPQTVTTIASANFAVSLLAYETSTGFLYRWTGGGGWIRTTAAADITGQIVTTQITDTAITTAKIAALNITSGLLAAGAVTAGKIAADAVVAGTVAAGAIGTSQLQAGAVTAVTIAAGTITTDKLYVAGGLGQALNADPSLRDATAWTLSNASIVTITDGISGTTAIRSTTNNFGIAIATAPVPFDRNKVYRFHVWLRRTSTAPGYFYYGATFRNGNDVPSNDNGGYIYAAHSGETIPTAGTWYEYNGTLAVSEGSVPSAAAYFYPILYLNYPNLTPNGYVEAQDFRVEEVLPGTLIKDGAITTAKLTALSVTSNELAADSAIFGKVAAGAIATAQLQTDSVTAAKIVAGAIQADKLIVTWAPGGSINVDPMTSDPSAWIVDYLSAGSNPIAAVGGSGVVGPSGLFTGNPGTLYVRSRQTFRLDWANKTYRIHAWIYNGSATGTIYLGLYAYSKTTGAAVSGIYIAGAANASPPAGTWTEYTGLINAATFTTWSQSAAAIGDAQLYALLNYPAGGQTGYYWLQDFRIEEVMPGTLIKDNSIVTGHLTSTTVTSAVMSISSLQSITPNMGVLVSGQLNGPTGMYLNLSATAGNPVLHGAQFDLFYNGSAQFSGTLVAAAGTFAGSLSAATGSFAGSLSAATGTFAGTLSAVGGTFTGSLSAATGTFAGSLSAATGTFAGNLSAAGGTFAGNLSAAGGTFAGDISAATGTFSGAISSGSFTTSYAQFAGRIELRGTLRIMSDSTWADAGTGGILFYRSDYAVVYGSLYMQESTGVTYLNSNAGVVIDSLNTGTYLTGAGPTRVMRTLAGSGSVAFQVDDDHTGALFYVDVPTNNNDTGLQVIYRNESGVYSFKRIRGDNINTGGSGNRNLRVLN